MISCFHGRPMWSWQLSKWCNFNGYVLNKMQLRPILGFEVLIQTIQECLKNSHKPINTCGVDHMTSTRALLSIKGRNVNCLMCWYVMTFEHVLWPSLSTWKWGQRTVGLIVEPAVNMTLRNTSFEKKVNVLQYFICLYSYRDSNQLWVSSSGSLLQTHSGSFATGAISNLLVLMKRLKEHWGIIDVHKHA